MIVMGLRKPAFAILLFVSSAAHAFEITPESVSPASLATDQPGCAIPKYTQELLQSLETGRVRVAFTLGVDGRTERVDVVSSSGSARLDAETIHAVRGCTFNPVALRGMGTAAQVVVPFDWVIPGLVLPKLQVDSDCRPSYPRSAREKGSSGMTVMSFLVKSNGEVTEPRLVRSSGNADLDAATKGIVECKATPGSLNGVPKDVRALVSYVWRFES